ncbi:DUF5686 family protein [Flavobacterium sp.]|uniref:DUF5686 family protein n=1 Tax=Flavobacterium sp. TaxID=239 RepID=UPI002618F909|nr:DUF5686 family protein [Flavobacterium sp.]
MKSLYLTLFLWAVLPYSVFSQVTGTVTDGASRLPLAFANVKSDTGVTVSTDINGKFIFPASKSPSSVTCTYIGYKTQQVAVSNRTEIFITMQPDESALDEVVITAVNPANAIIRKVIENKKRNNPENLSSFAYNCYNKVTLNIKTSDSVHVKLAKDKHLFMIESVTNRKFLSPDLSEETVTASRVSGFQEPFFAAVMTDFQPFSFYKDDIQLLDKHYLNPISNGSLNKYRFHLEEERIVGKDTVYIISFTPKPDKKFDALKGLLYINSNGYAVQNVVTQPAERKKIELHITQQYQFIQNQWFPEQLSFALVFNEYPTKKLTMAMEGKSYVDSVRINPPLRRRDFGLETVHLEPDATRKDSTYWNTYRREQLNNIDRKTYQVLDSVGKVHHMDKLMKGVVSFANGRLPIGSVDIDLNRTFTYNQYEGLRLGSGLYTNERLFKRLTLGGFYGYGLKDDESKYGGEVFYDISKNREIRIGVQYYHDLFETGVPNIDLTRKSLFDYRKFMGYQYDLKDGFAASVGFRSMRYFKWKFTLASEDVTPKYDYAFNYQDKPALGYRNSTLNVNLRFAYKEKLMTVFNKRTSGGTDFPVLNVSYTKGLKGFRDGDFDYHKVEAQLEQSFYTKNFGSSSYMLQAGYINTPLPYGLNFTGEGSYDKDIPVLLKNTFQTLQPYEFLSDRYVNVFLTHDFSGLLFKAGKFQPGISLHTNLGWGDLKNPQVHEGIAFVKKDKWFVESGLQLDSLLKLDYFGIADAGLGVAAFYRYGAYALPDAQDNIVFKFTFRLTLK